MNGFLTVMTDEKNKPVSSSLYDEDYYKEKCRGFEQFDKGEIHPAIKYALDLIQEKPGVVLDLGCGRGDLVYAAAMAGHQVYGIDYSEAAIGIAKKRLEICSPEIQKRVTLAAMDAKNLQFPDNTFDYIFALDIVEHLHQWELVIAYQNLFRVLKHDGKLIVHTSPNKTAMIPAYTAMKLFGMNWGSQEYHVNEQTYQSLKKDLEQQHFSFKIWILKDRHFWTNCIKHRNSSIFNFFAKIYDFLLDNPVSEILITKTSLIRLFGNDIWAIITKEDKS